MSAPLPTHLASRSALARLLYQPTGPLTAELVRKPGGFGLGQLPQRELPDATTGMVCGFCSTGCSLNIHLRRGEAAERDTENHGGNDALSHDDETVRRRSGSVNRCMTPA